MKTKKVISTAIVSFICILLASSFVLQTSAETISQTFSLQNVSVVDAVFDTNEEEQPADLSYVQNISVTEENPVPEAVYNRMDFITLSSLGLTSSYKIAPFSKTGVEMCYYRFTDSNSISYLYSILSGSYTTNSFARKSGVSRSYAAFSDNYYLFWVGTTFYMGTYDTTSYVSYGSYDVSGGYSDSYFVAEYGSYSFFFTRCNQPVNDSTADVMYAYVYNDGVYIMGSTDLIGTASTEQRHTNTPVTYCVFGKYLYCRTMIDKVIVINMETLFYERSISIPFSDGVCPIVADDQYLYVFTDQTNFYKVDLDTGESVTYTYPVNHNLSFTQSCNVGYVNGSFYLPTTNGYYRLYFDSGYYYDPLQYQVSPSIEVDKYINFSYQGSADGTENGDGFIGLNLNFGVPASYFAANEVTSVRFQSFALSYSSSSERFVTDNVPLPYNVSMTGENLNVLTTYYPKLVGKVGDVYLYNYNVIFYVSAGRVDSFDISLNTYIPAQTETHWFSIPCSTLDVSRYEDDSGGGGSGSGSDLSQIEADLVIIQDQMSGMLTKLDDVSEGIAEVENRLDEIQNILTSLPDDHESNMQQWSDNLQSAEEMESVINSYIDEYMSVPSMDASIEAGFSDGVGIIEDVFENQNTAYLFEFIRNMWTVHPYMLNMTSIVIVLGVLGIYIRSA